MKITATNLRAISSKTITIPDGVSLLVGTNGVGKSTIATVPYWILTGKGLSIKEGEKYCEGTVSFTDEICITRRIEYSEKKEKITTILFNGNSVTEKTLKAELARRNIHIEVLEKLYEKSSHLTNDDMLKAAGMNLDIDSICNLSCFEHGKEDMRNYFSDLNIDSISIPDISKAEKHFVEVRKNVKKEIKSIEAKLSEIPDKKMEEITQESEELGKKITTLIEEKANLSASLSNLNTRNVLMNSIRTKKEKIADILLKTNSAEETKNSLADKMKSLEELDIQEKELVEKENEMQETISAMRNEWFKASKRAELLAAKIADKQELIRTLTNTSVCPIYNGMPCTTNKRNAIDVLNKEIASLSVEKDESDTEANDLQIKGKELSAQIKLITEERTKINESRSTLINETHALENKLSSIEEGKKIIEVENNELNQLELNLNSICSGVKEINEDEINEMIAEREMVIELNQKTLYELDSLRSLISKRELLTEELKKKNNVYLSSDEIINKLRKLPEIIFERLVGPLESVANNVFDTLKPDWRAKFEPTGEVKVIMSKNNYTISQNELSSGEQILLNYCLKVVIATLIGMPCIIVDDCDLSDDHNYNQLISAASMSPLATVFISANDLSNKKETNKIYI